MGARIARASEIVDIYAKALFMMAKEKDIVEKVGADLKELEKRFKVSPLKMQRLLVPLFAVKEQRQELKPFLKGLSKPVQNFVYVLQRYKKLKFFFAMVSAYERRMEEFLGFVPVTIWIASSLTEKERYQIQKKIEEFVDKKILMHIEEKPSLLGGFQIQINSILIDGSILNALDRFYQKVKGEKTGCN